MSTNQKRRSSEQAWPRMSLLSGALAALTVTGFAISMAKSDLASAEEEQAP